MHVGGEATGGELRGGSCMRCAGFITINRDCVQSLELVFVHD